MNKTQRRATQKHRAKKAKIAVRRKAETAQQAPAAGRARTQAAAPVTRQRTTPRRQNEGSAEGAGQ